MICQNCNQPVDDGAVFCGNCGQQLYATTTPVSSAANAPPQPQTPLPTAPSPLPTPAPNYVPAPSVALPTPQGASSVSQATAIQPPVYAPDLTQKDHTRARRAEIALFSGISGSVAALFIPIAGLVLAGIGIANGIASRRSSKRMLSMVGLVFSIIALCISVAAWGYNINRAMEKKRAESNAATASSKSDVETPCYNANFIDRLNITHVDSSCNLQAFNGDTFAQSTNVYRIMAVKSSAARDAASFNTVAKAALEKDVETNLPGFKIVDQRVSGFAGSPAYTITAIDTENNIAVVETAVFRQVSNGENIFLIIHGINGDKVDLSILEAKWQWK